MTRVSATEDGCATDQMAQYYGRFAAGGFALVITEATYVDKHYAQGYHFQPGIATAAQRDAWKVVVDAVHAAGAWVHVDGAMGLWANATPTPHSSRYSKINFVEHYSLDVKSRPKFRKFMDHIL